MVNWAIRDVTHLVVVRQGGKARHVGVGDDVVQVLPKVQDVRVDRHLYNIVDIIMIVIVNKTSTTTVVQIATCFTICKELIPIQRENRNKI